MPMASRAPASLTLLALLFGGKLAAADLFNDPSGVPEVLTATRLKQSPAEVPGSISVLDRELIVATRPPEIPKLMRLVPGMVVGY
ncbi:TonB-dependent receptor, partial [Pseudomonas aeruginosa]